MTHCPDCGKPLYQDAIHTCSPQVTDHIPDATKMVPTCNHPTIETWRTADGVPRLWKCADCHQKFVPLTRQMIDDEALLRQALEYLERSADNYPVGHALSRHSHENTITALKERLK